MENITSDFIGAKEKELEVFYNDTTGDYVIEYKDDIATTFYDELNEEGDASNGVAVKAVQRFIDEF